ncbi:MAG: flavin reductase [Clostridia bacterium]|nr:flavin reductase [Clostridia bacterium]
MKKLENIRELKENPVKLISDDWALLSAGEAGKWNGMTVSWGGIGELWGKDVVFVFVRPQRYTKEFIDASDYFTLSFFDGEYKQALRICGRKSGRDCDKMQLAGLTGVFDGDAVYPAEARLVIKCKKIAVQKLDNSGFIDKDIEENYANGDYHYVYVGEIKEILQA